MRKSPRAAVAPVPLLSGAHAQSPPAAPELRPLNERARWANSVGGPGARAPRHAGSCSSSLAATLGRRRDARLHSPGGCAGRRAPPLASVPQRGAAGGRSRAVEVTSRLTGPPLPAMVGAVGGPLGGRWRAVGGLLARSFRRRWSRNGTRRVPGASPKPSPRLGPRVRFQSL